MTIARPTKVGQMQAYFPRSTWSNYRIADRSEIILNTSPWRSVSNGRNTSGCWAANASNCSILKNDQVTQQGTHDCRMFTALLFADYVARPSSALSIRALDGAGRMAFARM